MFGMSVTDILGSIAIGLTTIPMPRQEITENEDSYSLHEGSTKLGNDFTCAAQGFFIYFGLMCMYMYNASLWTYYAYSIASDMSEERIQRRVEPFLHLIPLVLTTLMASMPFFISTGGYVASNERPFCTMHDTSQDIPTVDNALPLPMRVLFIGCIMSVFVVAFTSFGLIIHKVWWTKRNLRQQSTNNSSPDNEEEKEEKEDDENMHATVSEVDLRKNVTAVLMQASAYILSYTTSTFLVLLSLGKRNEQSTLIKIAAVLLSAQGFFNCVIFISHKIYTFKQIDRNVRICTILWMLLRGYDEPIIFTRISMVNVGITTTSPSVHYPALRLPDRFVNSAEGGTDNESGLQMHNGSKNDISENLSGFDLASIHTKNFDDAVDINSESGRHNMNMYSGCSRNDVSVNSNGFDTPLIHNQQQPNDFTVDNDDELMREDISSAVIEESSFKMRQDVGLIERQQQHQSEQSQE